MLIFHAPPNIAGKGISHACRSSNPSIRLPAPELSVGSFSDLRFADLVWVSFLK